MPHHIDANYFKDWKREKKNDIFLFGTISTFYPFRLRLKNLLEKNKDKYKILFWEKFRNYFKFEKNKSNSALSKAMNSSWLTICTRGKYNMMFGKYFESSMSKSVVCGNMSEDGKSIWEDNYVNLDYDMTDEEILKEIDKALQYKSILIKKANKMYEKMKEYHLPRFSNKLYFKIQLANVN